MSKGSTQRPREVSKESFDQSFDQIFKRDPQVTCKRCGKTGLHPDGVHTCSPQVKKLGDVTEWPKEKK